MNLSMFYYMGIARRMSLAILTSRPLILGSQGSFIWKQRKSQRNVATNVFCLCKLQYFLENSILTVTRQAFLEIGTWQAPISFPTIVMSARISKESKIKSPLFSHKMNPLLIKFVRSRWLDIASLLFCYFIDLAFFSVHKYRKRHLSLGAHVIIISRHSNKVMCSF